MAAEIVRFGKDTYQRSWSLRLFLFVLRVLCFHRYDPYREPHTHARHFVWLIVKGGFVEHRPGLPDRWFGRWSVMHRRREDAHWLELSAPVWVVGLSYGPRKPWGFLTKDGARIAQEVIAARTQ